MLHCRDLSKSLITKTIITGFVVAPFTAALPGALGNLAGFMLGVLFCSLNFLLLARTLERAVAMKPAAAALLAFFGYFSRYLLTGIFIVIVMVLPGINFVFTILGLFLIKLIILANNIGCGTG